MAEILIKKYDNRRLYCVDLGKYVSLSEIREMVAAGDDIKVVEKSSGKDITGYVLTQILLEDRYDVLPLFFLKILIQAPRNTLTDFFRNFFPGMMNLYSNSAMGGQASNPWAAGQNPFAFQNPFALGQPFGYPFPGQGQSVQSGGLWPFGPQKAGSPESQLKQPEAPEKLDAEDPETDGADEELRRQMKELAERLAQLEGKIRKK